MTTPSVRIATADGVARITLDSPANRNALSKSTRAALRAALATALNDDTVRMLVLDHTGPVFCSGMDLTEGRGSGASEQGVNEFPALLETIWRASKPVIAVVRGPARAGGVGLLAACDIVVAAAAATFSFSEVRVGVVPAVISAVVLPRMAPHAAHRLMLTGEVFDAAAADRYGLIDVVASPADVDAVVAAQIAALRAGGPAALAETKRLQRGPLGGTFAELLDLSARFFASEEGQEGMAAFREKRPPRWLSVS